MKIDQFIWFVSCFQIFLTAQESYVSRLGRVIDLAVGNFASVRQSLQHYKSRVVPKCKFGMWAAVPTRTGRFVWDIYNEGENKYLKMFLYYLTN
ncbi:hypothetical protein [Flavobacterium sp. CF136]|uniref:hypothetical protein n=1 Tax=Flavobacterium sp. (strain CF136) TaxID=1144313 RepID=UPI000271960F|nr:hypothetical protein [Flavobacterium sp. CF136]EJL67210.1 hypothetical protein PMI10_00025 [Flavobacterium sp. CF136]